MKVSTLVISSKFNMSVTIDTTNLSPYLSGAWRRNNLVGSSATAVPRRARDFSKTHV
jgi:hypothetical protein